MWQLPQRNFMPFAMTVQSRAGARARTGAGAGAGAEAGDEDEAVDGAVAEGRRILLPRPGALYYMTAGTQRQDVYVCLDVCVCVCVECLCLSLQPEGHGCAAAAAATSRSFSAPFGGPFWVLRRLVSRNKRGAEARKMFCRL